MPNNFVFRSSLHALLKLEVTSFQISFFKGLMNWQHKCIVLYFMAFVSRDNFMKLFLICTIFSFNSFSTSTLYVFICLNSFFYLAARKS